MTEKTGAAVATHEHIYTAMVREGDERSVDWLGAIGSLSIPILSPVPKAVRLGGGPERLAFMTDFERLPGGGLGRIARMLARRAGASEVDVLTDIANENALPLVADGLVVSSACCDYLAGALVDPDEWHARGLELVAVLDRHLAEARGRAATASAEVEELAQARRVMRSALRLLAVGPEPAVEGPWHRRYARCTDCGTQDRERQPHRAIGRCGPCYLAWDRHRPVERHTYVPMAPALTVEPSGEKATGYE